jgi:microcystin-dependent protein
MGVYNIVTPGALAAGQPEDISVVLANFNAIASILNGGIDNFNLSPAAAIVASKLSGFPSDGTKYLAGDGTWPPMLGSVPTGAVLSHAGAAAPTGWVLCDGASYLRSGDPAGLDALFALIGTTYGSADGTHFNVPDLRGRTIAGYAAAGHADVATLGGNDGTVLASRRPKHKHAVVGSPVYGNGSPTAQSWDGANATGRNYPYGTVALTVGPQTGAEPTDAAAYIVLNYILKK